MSFSASQATCAHPLRLARGCSRPFCGCTRATCIISLHLRIVDRHFADARSMNLRIRNPLPFRRWGRYVVGRVLEGGESVISHKGQVRRCRRRKHRRWILQRLILIDRIKTRRRSSRICCYFVCRHDGDAAISQVLYIGIWFTIAKELNN